MEEPEEPPFEIESTEQFNPESIVGYDMPKEEMDKMPYNLPRTYLEKQMECMN